MTSGLPARSLGYRSLNGHERVAALLLTMGQQAARKVLQHFNPDEIRLVTKSAARLGQVSTGQIETLVDDFASHFSNGTDLVGNPSEITKLLSGIVPADQLTDIMEELHGNANRNIWERISGVSENVIASYLIKEHPQTAALILSKVKPNCAAKVMAQLPQELRNTVMRRMLSMKPIVDETMKNIEAALQENFMTNFSKDAGSDTHAKMADIINKMDRDHMDDVLTDLSNVRPKSAEILKSLLFTFDDLVKLTPKDRTALFDQITPDRVVIALKGTQEEFRQVILSALATRVKRMVENELSNKDPVPQRDVAEARRSITDLALEMASRGEIVINSDNGEGAAVF